MADKSSFKHITVNAAPEDDVVIQAGVVAQVPEDDGSSEVVEAVEYEEGVEEAPDVEDAQYNDAYEAYEVDEVGEVDEAAYDENTADVDEYEAPADVSSAQSSKQPSERPAARTDGYHETTLEDVESFKMGTVQKVVLVVAVLAIIAAIVWYVLR